MPGNPENCVADETNDDTSIDAVLDKALANFDGPAEPVTETPDEAPEATARDDGRDDKGRFVPKDPKPVEGGDVLAAADDGAKAPVETVEAQSAPPAAQPAWTDGHFTGWKPEQREAFAKLPADVQKLVMDRQSETTAFYQRKLAEAGDAQKQLEPILEATREVAPTLRSIGKSPGELIKSYANIEATLAYGTYADKLKLFGTIAQTYGIPFAPPEPDPFADPLQPQGQAYPVVHDLQSQIRHLESQLQSYQQQQELRATEQVHSTLAAFSSATNPDGSPKYPFYEVVKPAMGQLLADGKATTLEDAYAKATEPLQQKLQAELTARQRQAQEAQAQAIARAKKAAPVRSSGVTANGKTKSASLDSILDGALSSAGL
jgi:hypothetical protein